MITIVINPDIMSWDKETKTFLMSEKDVKFATTYKLVNTATGKERMFEFSHSTGPEFAPTTTWVYKCDDLQLVVCNDVELTKAAAKAYIEAKIDFDHITEPTEEIVCDWSGWNRAYERAYFRFIPSSGKSVLIYRKHTILFTEEEFALWDRLTFNRKGSNTVTEREMQLLTAMSDIAYNATSR